MGKDRFSKIPTLSGAGLKVVSFAIVLTMSAAVSGQTFRKLSVSTLPEPPEQLKKLLKAGRVTFEVGPRKDSADPRIIGETRYEVSYRYKSKAKWSLAEDAQGARGLVINVVFSSIQWNPKHVIWLRDQPEFDVFWENSVLLHEFDHLRISTDPRMARKFAELLKQRTVIRYTLQAGEFAGRGLTDRLVEREARAVFEEVTGLIAIRYRELDRETLHGRQPLLPSSELYDLLRSDAVPEAESGSRGASGNP